MQLPRKSLLCYRGKDVYFNSHSDKVTKRTINTVFVPEGSSMDMLWNGKPNRIHISRFDATRQIITVHGPGYMHVTSEGLPLTPVEMQSMGNAAREKENQMERERDTL